MMACVNAHHNNKKIQAIHHKAQKYKTELNLEDSKDDQLTDKTAVSCAKEEKLSAKKAALKQLE